MIKLLRGATTKKGSSDRGDFNSKTGKRGSTKSGKNVKRGGGERECKKLNQNDGK